MGLAASQARFLGLTARKTNAEYKGQQINQARTALSNEVMGLYRKYNQLDVPTPPSKTDFTKTVYTLDSTYENYQVGSMSKISSGKYAGYYKVTLEYSDDIPKAYTYTARDSVITAQKDETGKYKYLNFQIGIDSYTYDSKDEENSTITKIVVDENSTNANKYQGLDTVMKKLGVTTGTFYRFIKDGVSYYTSETELNDTAFEQTDEEGDKQIYYGNYIFDYQGNKKETKSAEAIAAITQDRSGRLASIQIIESEDAKDLVGNTYSITTSTTEDDAAYQDAMNKYNYKKDKYEREVERINKKTEIIQKQDRSLELELKEVDTEQNALKTEMDAVSKVIEDTIEKVFKTYNS